jgi:hypothetical protein
VRSGKDGRVGRSTSKYTSECEGGFKDIVKEVETLVWVCQTDVEICALRILFNHSSTFVAQGTCLHKADLANLRAVSLVRWTECEYPVHMSSVYRSFIYHNICSNDGFHSCLTL